METFTKEQLIKEIESLFVAIENKIKNQIEGEKIINKTRKKILGDILSVVDTSENTQAYMWLQYSKSQFEKWKTEDNIEEMIKLQVEINIFKKKIDENCNWENVKSSEFLERLEEIKVKSLKFKEELEIKNANELSESNDVGSNQQNVARRAFAYKITP